MLIKYSLSVLFQKNKQFLKVSNVTILIVIM